MDGSLVAILFLGAFVGACASDATPGASAKTTTDGDSVTGAGAAGVDTGDVGGDVAAADAGAGDTGPGAGDDTGPSGPDDTGSGVGPGVGADTGSGAGDDTGPGAGVTGGDDDGGGSGTSATCPSDTFLNHDDWEGPGGNYPAGFVNVTCDDEFMIVVSNGIVHHEFVPTTPNDLAEVSHNFKIPLNPELADETTTVPLLGTMAVAISGVPINGPNEAQFPDPFGDPIYNGIVDDCLGHPGAGGAYHYHALVEACFSLKLVDENQPSPILGWSMDGFPIHGSRGCANEDCSEIAEYKSGWVQTGDPETYAWDAHEYQMSDDPTVLDECNGHVGPKGDYHYHATAAFPYVLGCYSAQPSDSIGGGGGADGGGPGGDADGGGPGGGLGGADGGGPTSCSTDDDCVAECPDATTSCICVDSPNGQICVPSCTVDDDCPDGFVCNDDFCIPEGGGPGGGGPGGGGPGGGGPGGGGPGGGGPDGGGPDGGGGG